MKRNGMTTESILTGLIGTLKRITGQHNRPYKVAEKREAIENLVWIGHSWEAAKMLVENEIKANNLNV